MPSCFCNAIPFAGGVKCVPLCCFVGEALLLFFWEKDENFKKKQEEEILLQEHEEILNQKLVQELYLHVKKYGWISFQVNSKSITNAFWVLDENAQWRVQFFDNAGKLTLETVSQPEIDFAKLKISNTVEIGVNTITFAFTSTCVLVYYVKFDVSSIVITLTRQYFVCSATNRKGCKKPGIAGNRLQ